EAGDLSAGDARQVEGKHVVLEGSVVEVPDESIAPGRTPHGVEVACLGAPNAVDGLSPEARRVESLEVLPVEAENHRAGARHEDGPARHGLDPPEVAGLSGVELMPGAPIEVQ